MSVIERTFYVTIGAADAAGEAVQSVVGLEKLREKSVIERARDLEPKLRKQFEELATRGEQVVNGFRSQAKDFAGQVRALPETAQKQLKDFPESAQKQIKELRADARKQVEEIRGRFDRTNGAAKPKPTSKSSPAKSSAAAARSTATKATS